MAYVTGRLAMAIRPVFVDLSLAPRGFQDSRVYCYGARTMGELGNASGCKTLASSSTNWCEQLYALQPATVRINTLRITQILATPRLSAVDAKPRGQTAAQTPLPERALELHADRHRPKAEAQETAAQ